MRLRKSPEESRPSGVSRRARAAKHLGAAARALMGKDASPQESEEPITSERRIPEQKLPITLLTPDRPEWIRTQMVNVPEYAGRSDEHGNNVVLSFDLPGKKGAINFSVVRTQDGRSPARGAQGYPPEQANWSAIDSPAITIMPTEMLPWIEDMNDPHIGREEFLDRLERVERASVTVQAGQEVHIGREHYFQDILDTSASNDHLTIGYTKRTPGSTEQDATVYLKEHSSNGTNNVMLPQAGMPSIS